MIGGIFGCCYDNSQKFGEPKEKDRSISNSMSHELD